jgi:hypothetical protein
MEVSAAQALPQLGLLNALSSGIYVSAERADRFAYRGAVVECGQIDLNVAVPSFSIAKHS